MSKKISIIVGVLLGIILIALGGYYYSQRKTASTETSGGFSFKNFFPFGGDSVTPEVVQNEPADNTTDTDTNTVDYTKRLRKISKEPVSGAGVVTTKTGTIVKHIEKATGHIFETELWSSSQNRISNTTIPLAYDAVWTNDGKNLIAQYLKDDNETVDTYSLTLKNSTTTLETISGTFIAPSINTSSLLGTNLFYLTSNTSGSAGFISNIDGSKKKNVWNSEIREFLSQFVNQTTVALTTKPNENADGFLYFVNTTTGSSKKILGNIPGLTTLVSSDAKFVLYSDTRDTITLNLRDIAKGLTQQITPATFPEKCVWSTKDVTILFCAVGNEASAPANMTNWFKGKVSFSDDIWRYDLKNNTAQLLIELSKESNEPIDVIKPIIDETDHYLVFINKINGQLWSLDLTK